MKISLYKELFKIINDDPLFGYSQPRRRLEKVPKNKAVVFFNRRQASPFV